MSTLDTFIASRKKRPLGQFGQPHSVRTFNGKTACGPTSAQAIILAFRRKLPTLDAIATVMGYNRPPDMRGTTAEMNAKALTRWGLRYKAAYGLSWAQLRVLTRTRGPVMIVVAYQRYPNWKGYHGARPAPFAQPLGHAGANQFPKPNIRHWVVWAGTVESGPYKGLEAVFEPNHNSPARPEDVAIDYIGLGALNTAYRAAGSQIAVIPERSVS